MNDVQQRAAANHFAEYWKGKGYEKGESQKFWLSLLGDVFGVEHAAEYTLTIPASLTAISRKPMC